MKRITDILWKLKLWKDNQGQDLIEYALMAGFVAIAAGSIMPGVARSISTIFSRISSTMGSGCFSKLILESRIDRHRFIVAVGIFCTISRPRCRSAPFARSAAKPRAAASDYANRLNP